MGLLKSVILPFALSAICLGLEPWTLKIRIHFDVELLQAVLLEKHAETRKEFQEILETLIRNTEENFRRFDPPLEREIKLQVDKIGFVRQSLMLSPNVDEYYRRYREWRVLSYARMKPSLAEGTYFILVSGLDLYRQTETGRLLRSNIGEAQIGNFCSPYYGAGISEYDIYSSQEFNAIVFTRILARSLGVEFDDDPYNDCSIDDNYMMTQNIDRGRHPTLFSNCSRKYIVNFLKSDEAKKCIKNAGP